MKRQGKFVRGRPAGKLASVHTMAASGPIRRTTSVTLREPVRGELLLAQKLVQASGLTTALLLLGESSEASPDVCESEDGCAGTRDICPLASLT